MWGEGMSVEMKLGRWADRKDRVHVIDINNPHERYCWASSEEGRTWAKGGKYWPLSEDALDLIRYLGPIELSPTPACADQAGTPVVSTVSTETAGEQLRRVNARLSAVRSELKAYRAMVKGLEWVEGDLEELAKRLEKEVEG